ncbi:MAG: hypothetical protein ACOC2F_03500 [Bacteroidota bacterium]
MAFLIGSCASDRNQKKKEADLENFEISADILDDISTAKKIFYSLPSPLETAMIIKSAGADYDERLMNPTGNVNNYTTNRSMALNLGVYTTDMSFASLFDQTQVTINYMNVSKKLADDLGIIEAIDDEVIKRLEANVNNREVIMDIISETFMSSSAYLKDNNREAVATISLVGGWIEGLYIATQLVTEANYKDSKLVDRIVEQKLSFDILEKLLEQHAEDEDIQSLSAQLSDLREVFGNIKVRSTPVTAEKDDATDVTELKSQIEVEFTPEVFYELKETVKNLRSNFIL